MKKLLLSLAAALLTFSSSAQLKFNENKTFKIVQLTDIHWVAGNEKSEIAAENINLILDEENRI